MTWTENGSAYSVYTKYFITAAMPKNVYEN